jgi:hypothetical protein
LLLRTWPSASRGRHQPHRRPRSTNATNRAGQVQQGLCLTRGAFHPCRLVLQGGTGKEPALISIGPWQLSCWLSSSYQACAKVECVSAAAKAGACERQWAGHVVPGHPASSESSGAGDGHWQVRHAVEHADAGAGAGASRRDHGHGLSGKQQHLTVWRAAVRADDGSIDSTSTSASVYSVAARTGRRC